ncbi:DNA-binding transcriptional regulator, MarR family [Mameliella alba]|uniref:MarR family winged helix-turn-helix transcriptional regulator n=1 Tax=Mameliella alba TaxID=561184 RepID=UPI000890281C|nr:MarR family transcriptional regulator [Mameliella alba]PTR37399.1 DNA-binding MarR family transcriptional regulator [Mameliella alba]GGF74537.1 transcriptional regulator [Mameliella alba]SDD73146.1 DNA-binding transcriptional regulator, MarR family [Mameliella alba]
MTGAAADRQSAAANAAPVPGTELEGFFPYRLAVAAEGFSRNLVEVYGRRFGLSREEWRLLYLLAGEDEVTSLELGRRSTLDKVQVSRASQRLEEKGLITRAIAPDDRRLRLYTCTDKGRALFDEVLPQVEARSDEILRAMSTEDRAALERGLAALTEAMADRLLPSS